MLSDNAGIAAPSNKHENVEQFDVSKKNYARM